MARQKKSPIPTGIFKDILTSIGKPFYFVFSRILIVIVFILFTLGHTTRIAFEFILKPRKIKLPRVKFPKVSLTKRKVPKLKPFKFKLPKFKFFKFRLLGLKFSLFKLSIASKIKKVFKKTKKAKKSKLRIRFKLVYLFIFLLVSFSLFLYFTIFKGLPSPSELTKRQIDVSTKIYDRNGELLYKIYKDKNRTIIPLSDIPPHVRLATLAAEDAEFYDHLGFSVKGISRAFFANIRTGKLQGGSTITQQLVKNALLTPEKTITRKVKEVILAVLVESKFTKDEILEMYLNEVSYGSTAYGIEEASFEYFGKSVRNLNLAEAAFLAGLPQSPTTFSPFGQDPSLGFSRQKEVLYLMKINRFITKEQEDQGLNERLSFQPNKTEIKAPHFVMYVRKLLVDKYGEDIVERGGLEVTTTLDLSIQNLAQKVVEEEVIKLRNLHVGNGAAIILNPQTGEILGMVGSKDYFDLTADGNVNVTLSERQPGSSIKVINYAYALANGFSPASILDDTPVVFSVPGQPPYSPKNYDGEFKGKVSLRVALAESRNIPAVKILASYGVAKMIELGKSLGITTWEDTSRFGLSLTLGGGEVKLIELAGVYATIANGGKLPEVSPILQVKDYNGKLLEKFEPKSKQVLNPRVAYLLIDILKDNFARSGGFGLSSYLVVKNHPEVAVKTGTSNDLRDNLTVGFNQDYLVATWVGNNDNSPMARIASGVTGASPIWNKIMTAILNDKASVDWKTPEGLVKVNICTITGTLPCNGCPTRQEWFLEEKRPTKACLLPLPSPSPFVGPQIL